MRRLILILTFTAALAAVILQAPRLFGLIPYVVLSGSMEPAIPAGSVLYCHVGQARLEPGEIITYQLTSETENPLLVTHRIVEVREETCITKGDSNDNVDLAPVTREQIIGSYRYHIPWIGYVLVHLNQKLLGMIALWLLSMNLILMILGETEGKKERRAGKTILR